MPDSWNGIYSRLLSAVLDLLALQHSVCERALL